MFKTIIDKTKHEIYQKTQPHPSSSSETNSKHTFGSLPANIPHSIMGIPLLLDQIRMQKISGIQQGLFFTFF